MRYKAVAAALLLSAVLSSCRYIPRMSEITEYEVVRVITLDEGEEKQIDLTIVIERTDSASESGLSLVVSTATASGETVFDAMSNVEAITDARHQLGYLEYILIGEKLADGRLGDCLDYLIRHYESNYQTKVFLVRDGKASELVEGASGGSVSPAEQLSLTKHRIESLSNSRYLRLVDLIEMIDSPYCGVIIPALKGIGTDYLKTFGEDLRDRTMVTDGYAVFGGKYKISGFIELETARGYNAASDNFFSSHITVKAKNGGYVSLEGANFEYKCKPVWKEDELTGISIDLIFFVNVSQQTTPENIYTKDYIAYLQTEAAKVLDAEMLDVIKLSQKANSDFLALNDRVRVANPVRWERVKNGWNALFPKLEITAKTRVVIRRPYDIRMPVGSEEGVRDE